MPNFVFDYIRKKSLATGLPTDQPMVTCQLMRIADPQQVATRLNFRVDTGADISSVPLDLARDVLDLPASFTSDQVESVLKQESRSQGHQPIQFVVASGNQLRSYPLTVPVEIVDKSGMVGNFKALIAFSDGQRPNIFLAGLSGFLEKFDIHLEPRSFGMNARQGWGVTCQHPAAAGRRARSGP